MRVCVALGYVVVIVKVGVIGKVNIYILYIYISEGPHKYRNSNLFDCEMQLDFRQSAIDPLNRTHLVCMTMYVHISVCISHHTQYEHCYCFYKINLHFV